jgi:uncharacterized SAM-binding protein YcdF (DUF218 family)
LNKFWKCFEGKFLTKDDDLPAQADVVIAVGIDVSKDGKNASPYSASVAQKALEIFNDDKAKNILLCGGYRLNQGLTEAELMHALIARQVLDPEKVFLETQSKQTYLNADLTLQILQEHGWHSAIIVAQQWHARRVRATFKKRWANTGIKIYVIKAPSEYGSGSQKQLDHFITFCLWDTLAFVASKLKGYC